MDREGDAHDILAGLVGHNWRFVVRLTQPRLVEAEDGRPLETLFERVSSIPLTGERTVKLSARTDAGRSLAECNAFPARRERMAKLAVNAYQVVVALADSVQRARRQDACFPGEQ